MRRRKKKKEPRQKLILVTLAICVIILTILGIFVVFCPMPKPSMTSILGERQNEDGRVDFSNGDYVFTPDKDSIAYDEDNCVIFFNNQLIVYTFSEMSDIHVSELAEVVNGDVVGRLSGSINALQIRVKPSSFDELNSMADQLMAHDDVLYAGYDYPIQMFTDEVGNDAKAESMADSNPWSSDPSHPDQNRGEEHHPAGNDWWAEAIGAYTAWQYSDQCQPIEVGIVDNGFDTNHDDLAGHITFLPDYSGNTIEDHGTAVAGIIGARNNEIGIRGVADSADLVCVDWDPYSSEITYLSTGEYIEMIKQLAENGVKVINNSWGNCFLSFKSIRNKIYKNWNLFPIKYFLKKEEASLKKAGTYDSYLKFEETHGKRTALECTIMMIQLMLNDNKDFLIVQSAGNGLDNSGPGVDATNNAHFCAIDNNIYNLLNETVRSRLAQRKIDYNSIDERILIVGAVEKEFDSTGYKMTQYSNFGPTVDICAPGGYKDIFSTLAGNKYDYLYGTSMAAPMVTGSAAFIWSLNPDLTAPEVRNILLTNTISQVHGVGNGSEYTYPMLNVGTAAKAACIPENNGGSYVGYHGKTYYWKLSPDTHQDAVTFDGVTFNDPVESTKNELICRDADGTESTLVTGPVYSTKIYICDGKIFYRSHQYQVESIKLNGDGGPVECAEGYIEGVDYDNNLLAVSNSTSYAHTLVNAAMGATLASADKNIYFIGEEAGTVTYAIPDSTNTIIGIYQVKTDGTKSRQIAKIETGYAAKDMQLLGIEVGGTINGSNIYVSYVKVGGSYLEKFDGGLTRIDANTGESHNLVDFNSPYSLTNTDIYCVQHSDGSSAIYFIGGEGSYNSYMHPWADAKNTYYIKTSTGEVKQSTQPFIPDGSYALVNREIVMRQEGKDQMNVVMTSDELDMTGYTGDCDLSERNTGIDISSIDMVGNTFFVELVQSHRDVSQDVGWRPAQVFDSLTAYKREPGGNLTQLWSIPDSDNKSVQIAINESESDMSPDQQETDTDNIQPIRLQKYIGHNMRFRPEWNTVRNSVNELYSGIRIAPEDESAFPELKKALASFSEEMKTSQQNRTYNEFKTIKIKRSDSVAVSILTIDQIVLSESNFDTVDEYSSTNIDTKTGQSLALTDVIADLNSFTELVQSQLIAQWKTSGGGNEPDYDLLSTILRSGPSWTLDPDGITIYFNQYEFSDFAGQVVKPVKIQFRGNEGIFSQKYTEAPVSYAYEVPMDCAFFSDVNQDGAIDRISISYSTSDDGYASTNIDVNGIETSAEAGWYEFLDPLLVHLENGSEYLMVEGESENSWAGQGYCDVFNLSDGTAIKQASYPLAYYNCAYSEMTDSDISIMKEIPTNVSEARFTVRTDMLGTSRAHSTCQIGNGGKIIEINPWYIIDDYDQTMLTLCQPLTTVEVDEATGAEIGEVTLEAGEKVRAFRTDNSSYCDVIRKDNTIARIFSDTTGEGWISKINGVDVHSVFDGINEYS